MKEVLNIEDPGVGGKSAMIPVTEIVDANSPRNLFHHPLIIFNRLSCCSIAVCFSILLMSFAQNTAVAGQLYRCTDANGTETYTNELQHDGCKPLILRDYSATDQKPVESPPLAREILSPPVDNRTGPQAVLLEQAISGGGLTKFYERLKKLQKGDLTKISILHVGDSHVRAEAFPRKVAANLQSQFGSQGGTSCFPTEKRQPASRKVKKPRAAVSGQRKATTGRRVRRITLPPNPAYMSMSRKLTGGREPLSSARSVSIRRAPAREPDDVQTSPHPTVPTTRIESDACNPVTGMPDSPSGSGVSYNSFGVSGKTFAWYASQSSLVKQLQNHRPDLVIVTLGTNDAFAKLSYEAAWKDIDLFVAIIRSVSPDSSILFTTPPDSYFRDGSNNPFISVMRKVILDYASTGRLAAWDFYSAMGGEGSMNRWLNSGLARQDRIHLTSGGYSLKGEMLYTALINGYNRYLKDKH